MMEKHNVLLAAGWLGTALHFILAHGLNILGGISVLAAIVASVYSARVSAKKLKILEAGGAEAKALLVAKD